MNQVSVRSSSTHQQVELSPREMQLIALVVAGYNDRELAKKLGVTEKTAKSCLARIFERVGAANRLELVLITLHRRLLDGAIVLHTSTSPC